MEDISKIKTPDGTEYNIKDATARSDLSGKQATITASGVLQGDGSGGVTAKTLDTSGLTNDNDHVPTSGVVKSAIDKVAVRPNLFRNWYFVGGGSQQGSGQFPINQRRQVSYSASGGIYGIDGWKALSMTVAANYVSLNSIMQKPGNVENLVGKQLTFSVLLANGKLFFGTAILGALTGNTVFYSTNNITLRWSSYWNYFQIYTNDSTAANIIAVKLELGDTQTLAHNEGTEANPVWVLNEIPDYGIELLKCQRYLFIPTNEINVRCTTYTANGLYFDMPCPVELAGNPTIGTGLVIRSLDYTAQTGFTFTSTKRGNMNYLRVIAAKNGHGMTDGILSITAHTSISCEP